MSTRRVCFSVCAAVVLATGLLVFGVLAGVNGVAAAEKTVKNGTTGSKTTGSRTTSTRSTGSKTTGAKTTTTSTKKSLDDLLDEDDEKKPTRSTTRTGALVEETGALVEESDDAPKNSKRLSPKDYPATHKQVRTIVVKVDGKPVNLNTFCLAPNGDILACVGGDHVRYVPKADGEYDEKNEKNGAFVQVYSPEGDLKTAWPVKFKPTAINVAPNGQIFVAGQGKIAVLSAEGKVLKEGPTPNVGDYEAFKKQAVADAKKQADEYTKQFKEQIKRYEEQIAAIKPEDGKELSDRQKARIKALESAKTSQQQYCDQVSKSLGAVDPEQAVLARLTVTSLGVTEKDVFVCTRAKKGHGYEVWRCDHNLKNGESVAEGLSGCCGQLDIQAAGENFFVAENGRFRVTTYDRDGDAKGHFGKRDAESADGFGSCCNPMNMRCCPNGDLLVAESSIGNIKRFSKDGKFLGVVGKAKISGGCKHVALGWDQKRDWYYMMHVDKDHICVLVPNAQAGESSEEKAAKAARDGLGKTLIGTTWERQKNDAKAGGANALIRSISGGSSTSTVFDSMTFQDGGKLTVKGGAYASLMANATWEPVSQDGKTLEVALQREGTDFFTLKITFETDDRMQMAIEYSERAMGKATYTKKPTEKTADKDATTKK